MVLSPLPSLLICGHEGTNCDPHRGNVVLSKGLQLLTISFAV